MKLSEYCKKVGISYTTGHRWHKAGKLPIKSHQTKTGTILVDYEESKYSPPRTIDELAERFEKYTIPADMITLESSDEADKLNIKNYNNVLNYLQDYRFLSVMDRFISIKDMELLESLFLSFIHNKYDLTNSDIQSYISLCCDYVLLETTRGQKILLDDTIEQSRGDDKVDVKLLSEFIGLSEKLQKTCDGVIDRIRMAKKALEEKENLKITEKEAATAARNINNKVSGNYSCANLSGALNQVGVAGAALSFDDFIEIIKKAKKEYMENQKKLGI